MWNPFKKPPPPPPEPVSLGEEAIALFIVVGLAWLIKKIRDEKHLDITSMLHYVGDMCEVATYSFCYFLFAMYFGGVVEDIMPHYAKHTTYWCLWLEVLGHLESAADLCNAEASCSEFCELVGSSAALWRALHVRTFPGEGLLLWREKATPPR